MSDTAIAAPRRRRLSAARQAGIALVLAWAALAAFGPYLAPYRAGHVVDVGVFAPMSAAHPFGTDYLGRDMLSRILYGARYTVGVAIAETQRSCTAKRITPTVASRNSGTATSDTAVTLATRS